MIAATTAQARIKLPPFHPRHREIALDDTRFRVAACGRRFGKTRLGAALCMMTAGNGGRAWWVAPTYPVAQVGWRLIRRMAAQIPGAAVRQSERLITLPTGGEIQVRSADNPDSLRGEGLDFVVMDECAFIREEAWLEALRPALSDRRGRALFISTPKGRNWFWRLWQRCIDEHDHEWRGWQLPTADNPYIDRGEIEAARLALPERIYQQEFLAMFLDDAGGVFRRVMEAAVVVPLDRGIPGRQYVMGIDWAQSNDYTAVAVVDALTKSLVALERFNGLDYTIQRERIAAIAGRFRPSSIVSEANAMGRPNNEMLRRAGLPVLDFTTGSASKEVMISRLAAAFESGGITIVNDPVLIGELQAYQAERLAGGLTRYSAPAGLHDDTVIALALAYHGISGGRGTGAI